MFRLALKSVKHNPKRLVLTAAAVALGVSLVTASFTFTNGLSSGFNQLFSEIYGAQDVVVERDPEFAEPTTDPFAAGEGLFSAEDVEAIAAVDGVAAVAGGVQVMGAVLPADGPAAGMGGAPSQLFNWSGMEEFDLSTLVDGRGPERNGEIVLDLDSAPALGYTLGDPVTIATDTGTEQFTLVGTIRFGESNSLQGATLGFMTTEDAFRLSGEEKFQTVGVLAEEGVDLDRLAEEIDALLPEGGRAITGQAKAAETAQEIDEVLNYINIFAITFALISLFVGAYIIVNTFRVVVTQRTRELGLLRAIGSTGSQIRLMILLEALVIGVLASTIGIAMGYLLALAASGVVGAFAGDIFGSLALPLDGVLWSYVLGTVVTLVSALVPAIHASRIAPMEALRESATSGKKPLKWRNVVGVALTLLGVAAVVVGLFASVVKPAIWVGVGAVLIVLGVTLLAAQVLVPMAFGLRGLLSSWFGVDGKLAANNIRREPRRSANTAAALMIGVMLLALVATFTQSLKSVVTEQFQQTKADFFVLSGQGTVPPGALELIEDVDGVEGVTSLGFMLVTVDGTEYSVAVLNAATAELAVSYNSEPPVSELGDGVFIDSVVQAAGVSVGDEITLEGPDGTATLEVTGRYLGEGDANLWIDFDTAAALSDEVPVAQAAVVLAEDTDVDEAQEAIQEALREDFPLVILQQPGELEQLANTFIDLLLGVISALLASALVIAILGVANTLLLSVTERTREIGLLRAVGLKKSSVWRMITVESMVMAIFGTILGMVLGVSLGAALVVALEEYGFNGPSIPWAWLAVYTVLAAIAGVLAAIWPAWRASRLDILQAIAADG